MRRSLTEYVEFRRVRSGPLKSTKADGLNGFFFIQHNEVILKVMSSDGSDWDMPGEPWEHVSVSAEGRCPTWDEMEYIRNLFWLPEEIVIQFHPPKSKHINFHQHCLHMWRPKTTVIPLPPSQTIA